MTSTRARFAAVFLVTLSGIAAVAGYGWRALDRAADDVARTRAMLAVVAKVVRLEEQVHGIGARQGGETTPEEAERLARLLADLRQLAPQDAAILDRVEARVRIASESGDARAWSAAGEAISELEHRALRRPQQLVSELPDPSERRATRLLEIGSAAVLLFAVLSGVVYLRLRRERRTAHERLRRSDRLAALGTIAASVAHEINNPLATIGGCAAAVQDRLRKDRTEADPGRHADSLEYLAMIREETRRCSEILRSLRDLSREGAPALVPADLVGLAREVVALVGMDRDAKRVEIRLDAPERLEATVDSDKVKQLLLNLLLNARDACDTGGHVVLRLEAAADTAHLIVRDDGRGIARRDLARVFEPFHTDKAKGLGIGLYLCERIAAQHGGEIRAESAGPGRGATFTVTLPLRGSRPDPAPPPPVARSAPA